MSRQGPSEFAGEVGPDARKIAGMVRRVAITLTRRVLWQILGHKLLDEKPETRDAEPFTGVGFYSRPSASGKPEAVVVFAGGAGNPLIVATRDEKTRAALFKVAGELAENETAIFNSQSLIVIKADGTVEIRSAAGVAKKLVTFDEFMNHTHLTAGTGAPVAPTALVPSPPLVGTSKLKGE